MAFFVEGKNWFMEGLFLPSWRKDCSFSTLAKVFLLKFYCLFGACKIFLLTRFLV